jgi:hypothetical protein
MAKSGKPKDRQPSAAGQGGGAATAAGQPARWVRIVVSIAVVWHLFAVFISPLGIEPTSILVSNVATSPLVRWYTDSLYLNQGYHFFGPDPPRNHVLRYTVTDDSGAVVAEGSLPDKSAQWPRLYYHRHMMLADQAGNGPPDIDSDAWLQLSLRGYARHLLRTSGGTRATVECLIHNPLPPGAVLEGYDPNAPEMFQTVTRVEETSAALGEPLPVPAAPQPEPPASEELPKEEDL